MKAVVEGMSYADGDFFWLFTDNEVWIIAQYYCSCANEFLSYNVTGKPGRAYTVNKVGSRLANGQVLTKQVLTLLQTEAKVWRKFYIKEV